MQPTRRNSKTELRYKEHDLPSLVFLIVSLNKIL